LTRRKKKKETQKPWIIEEAIDEDGYSLFEKSIEELAKKHPDEARLLYQNLAKVFDSLQDHGDVTKLRNGCLGREGNGVWRIAQKNKLETRMYIYFDIDSRRLLLLNAGTKKRQRSDIKDAKKQLKSHQECEKND